MGLKTISRKSSVKKNYSNLWSSIKTLKEDSSEDNIFGHLSLPSGRSVASPWSLLVLLFVPSAVTGARNRSNIFCMPCPAIMANEMDMIVPRWKWMIYECIILRCHHGSKNEEKGWEEGTQTVSITNCSSLAGISCHRDPKLAAR